MEAYGQGGLAEFLATNRPPRILGYHLFEDKGVQGIKQVFVVIFLNCWRT